MRWTARTQDWPKKHLLAAAAGREVWSSGNCGTGNLKHEVAGCKLRNDFACASVLLWSVRDDGQQFRLPLYRSIVM
jgi:hypothetical protein